MKLTRVEIIIFFGDFWSIKWADTGFILCFSEIKKFVLVYFTLFSHYFVKISVTTLIYQNQAVRVAVIGSPVDILNFCQLVVHPHRLPPHMQNVL